MSSYLQQDRGDLEAYARYLANMDAAMRQKVALTAVHLPCQGRVADMGMGSGAGSQALAALYPRLQVVGVDVNPTMVEVARQTHQLPNLEFREGDIAQLCFDAESLDGIVNSSVLHHVTSYNGYGSHHARRALQAQVEQLALHGTLIVRDFLAPEPGEIELRLPPHWESLWRRYAQEFRALAAPDQRGQEYQELGRDEQGWLRLRCQERAAVEFLLRKDYQQDWDTEILEEYTYFTQAEFEEVFLGLGLRVLISTPLHNPWIARHRFQGQFEIHDQQGPRQDFPATNYLIVGEKVRRGVGVTFRASRELEPRGFLHRSSYRHCQTGRVYDLVCRPHPTVDVLPFWISPQGNLSVVARHSYPRPILSRAPVGLDGLQPCPYTVEPLAAIQGQDPLGDTVDQVLQERAGLGLAEVLEILPGEVHYPSPGGIREEVRTCFARLRSLELQPQTPERLPWSEAGQVRALDAHQLLRSAQVHGLSDHRLEMHVFSLMRKLGVDPGPWLGDSLDPLAGPTPTPSSVELRPPTRRAFLPAGQQDSPQFLKIERHLFEEMDAQGQVLGQAELESAVPTRYQSLTVATLPMAHAQDGWWVGLDLDDLPAVQAFSGSSCCWVAPAWRVPRHITSLGPARKWLAKQLESEFSTPALEWITLGGPYFPSPGLQPELVYPQAVRVDPRGSRLHFFPLERVMQSWEEIPVAHLRCLLLRAWLAHRPQA